MVGLRRADVETAEVGAGHVVGEIYLADIKKWVMADAQFGFIPMANAKPLEWVAPCMYYVSIRLDQRSEVNPRSFNHVVLIPITERSVFDSAPKNSATANTSSNGT